MTYGQLDPQEQKSVSSQNYSWKRRLQDGNHIVLVKYAEMSQPLWPSYTLTQSNLHQTNSHQKLSPDWGRFTQISHQYEFFSQVGNAQL